MAAPGASSSADAGSGATAGEALLGPGSEEIGLSVALDELLAGDGLMAAPVLSVDLAIVGASTRNGNSLVRHGNYSPYGVLVTYSSPQACPVTLRVGLVGPDSTTTDLDSPECQRLLPDFGSTQGVNIPLGSTLFPIDKQIFLRTFRLVAQAVCGGIGTDVGQMNVALLANQWDPRAQARVGG